MKSALSLVSISALLVCGLAGAFWLFSGHIQRMHERAHALGSNADIKEQRSANIESQRHVLRELGREGVALERYFFKEGEALDVINRIEDLGIQSETVLLVRSVHTQDGAVSPLGAYVVDVEVQGTFSAVHHFIESAERLPYATRVVSYDVGLVESETARYWKGNVTIVVAYIRATDSNTIEDL